MALDGNSKIFIIIPCWNESLHLGQVINRVKPYGEVVIVDDGSSDNSFAIASNLGVKVLRHVINRGQGAALETGDQYAQSQGADVVVHFDADGQHQVEDIPLMIQPIIEGRADIVLGSRFLGKSDRLPFIKKWLILKPANLLQNFLFNLKLTDAQNGLRAMSAKALSQITITQDGFAHCSEIMEQISLKGLKYLEVPVTVVYDEFGQGFLAGLKILIDLLVGKLNK